MKRFKTLTEAVSIFVNKGYRIDFDHLSRKKKGFHKPHAGNNPPEDFRIDEIFCCGEGYESNEPIYVFAISSKRHRFKGILMNAYNEEKSWSWSELKHGIEKIKKWLLC